jgi:hypothetical protein
MGNLTLNGATSGQITIAPPAVAGTNTLTLPASTGNILTSVLVAGTASVAPLTFTSGTNLTSATAGAFEYDGTSFYGTPIGAQRGIVPGMQFYRIESNRTVASASGAFSVFGVGATISSSTVYSFEALYATSRTAGTTSHTVSLLFGGTATYNNFSYYYTRYTSTSSFSNDVSIQGGFINAATAVVITGSRTTPYYDAVMIRGSFSCNAGGTFIPQLSYSAAPGGSTVVNPGSFVLAYPIGAAGSNTSVGTWA